MVSAICRFGVAYSHINVDAIQQRPQDNSGEVSEKLPWGEWDNECPYFIVHKDNYYLRCTVSRSPNHHRKVTYLLDGVEITREEAMKYTRPSEWNKQNEDYVYNPKLINIVSIGKEVKQ